MKLKLSLVASVLSCMATAAQIQWGAFYIPEQFANGTAYLIQTDSTVTSDQIVDYVKQNGFVLPGEGVTNWLNASVSGTLIGEETIYNVNTASSDIGSLPSENHWWTIIIAENELDFALSGTTETTVSAAGDAVSANFNIFNAPSYWQVDTIFVPEPTALALLALGVAGVALRRRVC